MQFAFFFFQLLCEQKDGSLQILLHGRPNVAAAGGCERDELRPREQSRGQVMTLHVEVTAQVVKSE